MRDAGRKFPFVSPAVLPRVCALAAPAAVPVLPFVFATDRYALARPDAVPMPTEGMRVDLPHIGAIILVLHLVD